MTQSIDVWLTSLGLEQYRENFADNAIDWEVLADLTDADLREMGISALGHRKRLMKAISGLSTHEHETDERAGSDLIANATEPEAERRHLTVMFCDLVDSTGLSTRLDPEDLSDVVRRFQTVATATMERFHGYVARYMGDGLLVYFGYPAAQGDDAHRALRAGVELILAVADLKVRPDVSLQVRIGAATGAVVVGETIGSGSAQEQVVLGETPNLAARLQGLAAPNTMVVDATTRLLVLARFELADLGTRELKGFAEPVRAFQVGAVRNDAGDGPATSRLSQVVAREQETALVVERWRLATEGDGQAVFICGEAGIGKSRMVEAARDEIGDEGVTRLVFRCSPYESHSALHGLRAHLERVLGLQGTTSPDEQWEKLASMLSSFDFPTADTPGLFAKLLSIPLPRGMAPLALPPAREKERTLAALVAWVAEESELKPVLIIWEDLHFADPSTLELVDLVVTRIPTMRALAILTARPEYQPPWGLRAHITTLTLSRLSAEHIKTLCHDIVDGTPLPAEVLDEIITRTGGVPLFIEELTKSIVESGVLRIGDNGYELASPLSSVSIPITLNESLMARLDQLGPAKAIAQIASVIGRQVDYSLLLRVAARDESVLGRHLDQLVAAELLFPLGAPPTTRYLFKHALIRDAAYESLLRRRRQTLHGEIGEAIESSEGERPEQAALLAYHFSRSPVQHKAARYALMAGDHAVGLHARIEAISHYELALAAARAQGDTGREAFVDAALKLASVGASADELARSNETLLEALEVAEALADQPRASQVLYWLGRHAYVRGDAREAFARAEEGLAIADSLGDERLAAPVVNLSGRVSILISQYPRGAELAARSARQMHAIDNKLEESTASAFCASMLGFQGQFDEAIEYAEQAMSLAVEIDNPFAQAAVHFNRANVHHYKGEWLLAFEHYECSRVLAREVGDPFRIYIADLYESWARTEAGEPERGLEVGLRAEAANEHLNTTFLLAILKASRALAHSLLGQPDEALTLCQHAIELAAASDTVSGAALAHRAKAMALQLRSPGDTAKIDAAMAEAIRLNEQVNELPSLARVHFAFARLLRDRGEDVRAREHAAAAMDLFERLSMHPDHSGAAGFLAP